MQYPLQKSSDIPEGAALECRLPLPDVKERGLGIAEGEFLVVPYYVYPRDHPYHAEYEQAVSNLVLEIQEWYRARVGTSFRTAPLRAVQSSEDYLAMRCGPSPVPDCASDRQRLDQWLGAVQRAVGGFPARCIPTWAN